MGRECGVAQTLARSNEYIANRRSNKRHKSVAMPSLVADVSSLADPRDWRVRAVYARVSSRRAVGLGIIDSYPIRRVNNSRGRVCSTSDNLFLRIPSPHSRLICIYLCISPQSVSIYSSRRNRRCFDLPRAIFPSFLGSLVLCVSVSFYNAIQFWKSNCVGNDYFCNCFCSLVFTTHSSNAMQCNATFHRNFYLSTLFVFNYCHTLRARLRYFKIKRASSHLETETGCSGLALSKKAGVRAFLLPNFPL